MTSTAVDIAETEQVEPFQTLAVAAQLMPLTAERKLLCAEVLVRTGGNISKAAELLGTTRQNIHRWAQSDPAFRELFEHALEYGTDNLEESYYNRALSGSDRATEFLLRARRPEKYNPQAGGSEAEVLNPSDVDRLGAALLTAMMEASARMRAEGGLVNGPVVKQQPALLAAESMDHDTSDG